MHKLSNLFLKRAERRRGGLFNDLDILTKQKNVITLTAENGVQKCLERWSVVRKLISSASYHYLAVAN